MGGKSTSTSATKLNQISVQSSSLGVPITAGWGRARTNCNLLWYGAFNAIPHTTKQSGGKGLGGSSSNTTYTYTASIIMGLCEGGASGIQGVRTVYRDKSTFSLAGAGLSLATGTPAQAVWGYLATKFPSQAINYSGIAYVYAQDYALDDSASLPNHSFEIDFGIQLAGAAGGDADPKDIVSDCLTNAAYGVPGWPAGMIGDLSDWSLYCRSNNLLLSPVLDSQRTGQDFFAEIATATNSEFAWSEGVLKIGSYGDSPATGNGVTWTPNLTPAYDLTEDDLIPVDGKPVKLNILDQSDAFNIVQVEFLDRSNQYNVGIQTAQDLADIVQNGKRKQDPTTIHSICDPSIAQQTCQLLLQRTLYMREEYTFRLPDNFALLEPMIDTVTLTTTTDELRLSRKQVRITQIVENRDGTFDITAKGMNIGNASAALYNAHSGSGYVPNLDIAPGSVSTPMLINAPTSLTGGAAEVWIAAGSINANWGGCEVWVSADNIQYHRVGSITAAARVGVSTASLPSHTDPDTGDTLSVDLTASAGVLSSSNAANAAIGSTLCLLGSEIVSYQTATLTGAYQYALTNLRRGLYGTTISAHATGQSFARLDEALFKYDYGSLALGSTIYVKLPSFNIFGRALEDISTVLAYTVQLTPNVTIGSGSLQSFTLNNRANCYIDGRTISKITGGAAWNASVLSSESFIGGCMCGFQPLQSNADLEIGLNSDPGTDDAATSIDYGWYCSSSGNCQPYLNGSAVSGVSASAYAATDTFQITYSGTTVTWLHNGSVVASQTVASNLQLWLDSSFYTVGGKATNVTFAGGGSGGGGTGTNGYSTNVITLYQRSATTPTSLPSADITYTFATQGMSPAPNNGWVTTPPAANGSPLWVTQATAYSNTPTATIAHTAWTTAVQFTADGLNTATVVMYQRAASAPSGTAAAPSASLTYTFATGLLSPSSSFNGWSQTPPAGTNPLYQIQATASATATAASDTIPTTEWSAPVLFVQNGAQGSAGASSFTLIPRGGCSVSGGTISKTSGSGWGSGDCYTTQSFTNGSALSFQPASTAYELMVALNTDPTTDESYTSLDYAIYLNNLGEIRVYESGAQQGPTYGTYAAGDTFQIVYNGSTVNYIKNGTSFRTSSGVGSNRTFYFDSAFNQAGGQINNVTFAKAGADGTGVGTAPSQAIPISSIGTSNTLSYLVKAGVTVTVECQVYANGTLTSGTMSVQSQVSNSGAGVWSAVASGSDSYSSGDAKSLAGYAIGTYTNSTGSDRMMDFRVTSSGTGSLTVDQGLSYLKVSG